MESFSKKAFVRVREELNSAGPDSELVRRFVTDEVFALELLRKAEEVEAAISARKEAERKAQDDFDLKTPFW